MKTERVYIRLSIEDKKSLVKQAKSKGFSNVSEYIRYLIFRDMKKGGS